MKGRIWFFVILAFVAGLLIGYAIYYITIYGIEIENKIDPIAALTFLATLFLAVYVPIVIEKSLNRTRFEKEALITKVKEIHEHFKIVYRCVNDCYEVGTVSTDDVTKILAEFRYASQDIATFIDISKRACPKVITDKIQILLTARRAFLRQATGNGFTNGYVYTIAVKAEVDRCYQLIDMEIHQLIFDINSY